MNTSTQSILALIASLLGVGLMIGGIATDEHGATVIGMIVSGVAAQRFMALRKQDQPDDKG